PGSRESERGTIVPRPDKPRTIGAERNVALRVRLERIARGWSYATFASKMSDAGYPIHGSAVYKIEHGTRRITVEELVAISYVFGLDIEDLISTPDDRSEERRGGKAWVSRVRVTREKKEQ